MYPSMLVKTATFVISNSDFRKCPAPDRPEYAFIGRSNVGKSSLINMLLNRRSLARTSNIPGKTRLLNHFLINEEWYLVDLPGIGYTKVGRSQKKGWLTMITHYLIKRKNLLNSFYLVDSRIDPQNIDLEFINWMGASRLPFTVVFTKTDKIPRGKLGENIKKYQDKLLQTWDVLPPVIISSSKTGAGRDEILGVIEKTNLIYTSDRSQNS